MTESPRRGRPPATDPRKNQTFRLLPSVLGALDSIAAARGTSPTRLLEDLIMTEYKTANPFVVYESSQVQAMGARECPEVSRHATEAEAWAAIDKEEREFRASPYGRGSAYLQRGVYNDLTY